MLRGNSRPSASETKAGVTPDDVASVLTGFLPFEVFCDRTRETFGHLPEEMLRWFSPNSEQGLKLRLTFASDHLREQAFGKALSLLLPLTEAHARQAFVWVLLALTWRGLNQKALAEKAAARARMRQADIPLLDTFFPRTLPACPPKKKAGPEPKVDNGDAACLARQQAARGVAKALNRSQVRSAPPEVLIVIPFYGSPDVLGRLLTSLEASLKKNRCPAKVVVIDDATPWVQTPKAAQATGGSQTTFALPALADVQAQAQAAGFLWLQSPCRGGFIGAANIGFFVQQQLNASPHLLLLNSDCVVPNSHWLDRMVAHLKRTPRLASLMPFSNAAEFASLPEPGIDNPLPSQEAIDATDRAAQRVHEKELIRCPGAIGFCWLIRNSLARSLKGLDEKHFHSGYGEDTDFCARASEAGFWHGLAADVFVGHEGSASYGSTEKTGLVKANARVLAQRYPGLEDVYESWAYTDPLRVWRERILRVEAVPA